MPRAQPTWEVEMWRGPALVGPDAPVVEAVLVGTALGEESRKECGVASVRGLGLGFAL